MTLILHMGSSSWIYCVIKNEKKEGMKLWAARFGVLRRVRGERKDMIKIHCTHVENSQRIN